MARSLTAYNPGLIQDRVGPRLANEARFITSGQTWTAGMFLKSVSGLLVISSTSAASGVGADAIQFYALSTLATDPGNSTTLATVGAVHEDDLWEINLSTDIAAARTISDMPYQLVTTGTTLNTAVSGSTHAVFKAKNPVWVERPFQDLSTDTTARITVQVLPTAIYTVAA